MNRPVINPHQALADAMVEHQLRARGLRDEAVLRTMAQVPRHLFVPRLDPHEAYADRALPTMAGQTISQPYMVAVMTECLRLNPGAGPGVGEPPGAKLKVLEIGTGSGYQAALLAHLGANVVSMERHECLAESARQLLDELGYGERVKIVVGDGTLGCPAEAPFDRILVTAGAPHIPNALREQLVDGGIIVIPVGDRDDQDLLVAERSGDQWRQRYIVGCRFVPLVGEQGWTTEDER